MGNTCNKKDDSNDTQEPTKEFKLIFETNVDITCMLISNGRIIDHLDNTYFTIGESYVFTSIIEPIIIKAKINNLEKDIVCPKYTNECIIRSKNNNILFQLN